MAVKLANLGRLLNDAPQPIYVLDAERTLIYCNQACLDWLGVGPEKVLGQRCAYHSSPNVEPGAALAAGLCPPPEAFFGTPSLGTVVAAHPEGGLSRRSARFLPLGPPEEWVGLLVVVDSADRPAAPERLAAETVPATPGMSEAARLHQAIQEFRRQAAVRYRAERLLGTSLSARRLRAQVAAAAENTGSVLLVGPRGSGRQHTAATIHYAGPTEKLGNLVPLACPVLGAELLSSTIVALASARSPEERGLRATLVLNDADQIPLEIQAELASVLGAKGFPFRLIATARSPLLDLARAGHYREDLAVVLSTQVIEIPRLSSRPEDIPLLAQALLEDVNAQGGKQVSGFTSEALDALAAYDWPGNMDELAAVVAEAHRGVEGPWIRPADLPERLHQAAAAAAHPRRAEDTIALDEFLRQVERELVRRALARAKGNKAKAARLLGLTRPRLYRRMVALGLAESAEP